jgi:hypothetical protein
MGSTLRGKQILFRLDVTHDSNGIPKVGRGLPLRGPELGGQKGDDGG